MQILLRLSYADAVNVTDFEGATLTSTLNTVWYDVLDQITDYATKDAALDTFASMVAAVHAGKIDGFTCDMPSAKSILVSNPDLKIIDFEAVPDLRSATKRQTLVSLARKETQN